MRIPIKSRIFGLDRNFSERSPPHKGIIKLERTVFHQLGIQSAVGSKVDIFEKHAVHIGIYLRPGFHRDRQRTLSRQRKNDYHQQQQKR